MTRPPDPAPAGRAGAQGRDLARATVLALLLSGVWIAVFWTHWPLDLNAVWFAGHFLASGRPDLVYVVDPALFPRVTNPEWLALSRDLGCAEPCAYPYVYPPLWAGLAAPVTRVLDPVGFNRLVLLVNVPALFLSLPVAWRLWSPPVPPVPFVLFGGIFASVTVVGATALANNQPQLLTAFLMLLALERAAAGRPVAGGIALGLAVSIKLYPLALALFWLRDGNGRALMATGLAVAALALAGLAAAGPALHLAFLAQLSALSGQVLPVPTNLSLASAAALIETGPGLLPGVVGPVAAAIGRAGPVLLLAGLALIGWRARLGGPHWRARTLMPALLCLLVLTLPVGWVYYLLIPLLALPVLAERRGRPVQVVLVLSALLLVAPLHAAVLPEALAGRTVPLAGSAVALLWFFLFALAPAPRDAALRPGAGGL